MTFTLPNTRSSRRRFLAPVTLAIAALLGSVVSATPAAALALVDIPADPAAWAATPYSPLPWTDVAAPGNSANLTFDGEAGGLPDASGVGTGFSVIQPSTAAATSPYYIPENLSIAGGKLAITATPGIANLLVNTQDNTLGFGVDANGKALYLTTTLTSPAALNGFAQGGLWFGANDDNYVKLVLIGNAASTRQIQLAREVGGAAVAATDQIVANTTQAALGTQPIKLDLIVDGINKRVTASYQVGTTAPVALGTLSNLPASFFDGSSVLARPEGSTVNSLAGIFATRRNLAGTTPFVLAFDNFGFTEVDVTPPAAPTSLTTTTGIAKVDLAWQAPADTDVVGYRVYRSSAATVPITGTPLSGIAPISAPNFSDDQTFGGVDYNYAVVAVDSLANVSPPVQAGPVQTSVPGGDVIAKIDFTTAAGTAAAGYQKDEGLAFDAARGFGWENAAGAPTSIATETRVRGTAGVEPRLDSMIHLQYKLNAAATAAESVWQYNVPNGTYTVVAAVGDSGAGISASTGYDSQHTIRAEGSLVFNRFQAGAARQYDEAVLTGVTVADGRLTIDALGGTNTKISYLEIYRTSLDLIAPATPTGLTSVVDGTDVTVSWAAADNAVSYKIFRGATADVATTGTPLGTSETPSFTDLSTEAGTTYHFVVVATSADELDSAGSASLEVVVPEVEDPNPPQLCASNTWKAETFAGTALAGVAVTTTCVSSINQNYDAGAIPAGLDSANQYSMRWTRTIDQGAGSYEFTTRTDDGVRIKVDGTLVLNEWYAQAADRTRTLQVPLTAGPHEIVVEYYQGFGDASAIVNVRKAITSCATGEWLGEYFSNTSLTGAVAHRECVSDIDQEFAAGEGPDDVGSSLYSIRWTRSINEGKGTYLFSANTDDGVRVKVDGQFVINEWYDQDASETHEKSVSLAAGSHLVVVEYYQGYNTASAVVGFEKTSSDTQAPDVPTQVFTVAADDAITVNWTASPSTDTVGYRVYRGATADVDVTGTPLSGNSPVDELEFEDATAVAGTTYYYVVTAIDDSDNESAPSAAAMGLISLVPDTEAPAAPTALTATTGDASVALTWTASASTDTVGYRVYRGTEPIVSTTGTPISGASPVVGSSFTDGGVTNGTTYFYVVVAIDTADNKSVSSNEVVAVPLPANTTNVKIDFTATNAAPVAGYFADWGQAFGLRTGATQGSSALSYGWLDTDVHELSLVGNGRVRVRPGIPALLGSMIHMQYGDVNGGTGTNGIKTEGVWELAVPDGLYEVTLAVGDEPGAEGVYDSTHVVNVEGTVGVESFVGTAASEFRTITTRVGVWDGELTLDAKQGFNTKLAYVEVKGLARAPHVDTVLPENRVTGHDVNAGVSATIKLPYAGVGVNPTTLPGNVHLNEVSTGAEVPTTVGSSGGNDVISLAPNTSLKPNTAYRFTVTSGVKDNFGAAFVPFTSMFTSGSGEVTASDEFTPLTGIAFEKIELPTGRGKYWSTFAFGPDGKLYGTTIGEGIWRFPVNADGTLGEPESLGYEGVAHIGLLFDKTATAGNLRVWVTRTTANFSEQGQWVSSVHLLTGPDLATDREIFNGLPRSLSDHLTNSMAYGPDGRIYFQQGSNQASGDLDNAWGQRGEQLLTAATLVFDPANPQIVTAAGGGGGISVKTADGGTYSPYTATAPLKIYASGIRNAYDLVWHSNNHLYVSTNGTAGGANTPGVTANANGTFTRTAAPGIPGFSTVNGRDVTAQCVRRGYTGGTVPPTGNIPTQKDLLFDVVEGGYYGHPNPERCEFVLNAGNDPATATAPGTKESRYPLGTKADPNYRGVAFDYEFNKSPNGSIEYKSSTFGGQLKGRLITTRFSNNNDLIFMQPDAVTGKILGAQLSTGITGVPNTTMSGVDGFNDPLEVVENVANGNLYVNQYDRSGQDQRLYLLRVPANQQAASISTSASELIFSTVKSTTSASKTVTVTNNAATAATVSTSLVGGQASEFTVTGGNVSVPAKASITLTVTFKPGTTVGQRASTLRIVAGESSVDVGLYGLSTEGIEGIREPTLANVLGTLGYPVNVGWTNLEGGVQPAAKGDEVLEPLFVKSGTAAPTVTPLAQYAPREDLPYGWYTGDGATADRRQLGSIAIGGYQSLLPPTSAGTSPSFDPGTSTFGFYYVSNVFQRVGYTEDRLNAGTPHRARIYPAKNRAGTLLTNSYIVAFEDASNGDYQDYLFLVTGVKPVTDTGTTDGAIRVDFTTKAGDLAAGYLRDYGQAYAARTGADQGSGLRFGWKNEATEVDLDLSVGGTPAPGLGNGRDRATTQPDARLDSFMHMHGADVPTFNGNRTNAYWEIALPDGDYTVTVAVGDPAPQTDVEAHSINIEQIAAITRFTPTGLAGTATRHQTATKTVTVTDGALTIDSIGGTNTKISYVDVVPVVTNPGGGDGDDPTDGAQVKVNFQTPDAPTPAGWTADIGAPYSAAAGSGWVITTTAAPLDRTTSNRYRTAPTAGITFSSDVKLQTFAFLQTNPVAADWEYKVPDGTYEVAVSVGDSGFLDSVHRVTAEGQPVIADFTPTGTTPFQTGKRTVTVTDGKLTIAGTGTNTKINWVSIKGDGLDGTPVPTTPSVKINFQPSTITAPAGWTPDTGSGFTPERGYGWFVNGVATDRSANTRHRTVPTTGIAYPTGDLTRQTLILTQASPTAGTSNGTWEYAVANGIYQVSVSVGDAGFLDSTHGVNAENVAVVTDFAPTGTTPFTTGTKQVTVTDGRLTLTPTGENTKFNWITITGDNFAAPSVALTVNGAAAGTSFNGASASIAATAVASGTSTIQSLTWAIDGGTPVPYTTPISVTEFGTKMLTVVATDSEGRTTTRSLTLLIEDIGGTVALRNEQATRVNGAVVPGFSEDWLVMHRINSGTTTHQVIDTATVTVSNTGVKDLKISNLAITGTNSAQFEIVTPAAGAVTVAPGASTPVTVKFIANSGSRGIRSAQLNITSSDLASAITTVQLRGGYMTAPEGTSELSLNEISALYGWTTTIGNLVNGDEMRTSALKGDEVRSLLWKRADTSLPVTARQLAAFHGCCDATELININGATARHAAPYGQTILPVTATGAATQLSTNPTGNFGIVVAGQTTNNAGYMAMKTWPVIDRNNKVIPGSWIVGHDYIASPNQCGIAPTNCDFQDNVYLVTNVLPVASSDTTAPVGPTGATAAVTGTSVTVNWTASAATDLAGYYVERATSATGPWTRVSGGTPVAATSFVDSSLPFAATGYYRVLAADSSGNASVPSNTAEVDISGLGTGTLRINAGGPAVTTPGGSWLADTYFTGGKTYSNGAVTQIAGTTDDAVYLTERSFAGAFAYDVPVPDGTYSVKLHFAEIYHGATGGGTGGTGKRVFNVNFEGGTTEIVGLDLNARVAPMTAYTTTNLVGVTGGNLDIDFTSTVNEAKLSAIEITRSTAPLPVAPAAPTALAATVTGTSVALGWTASSSADVAGYFVERATVAAGPFTRISGTTPVAGTSYTDAGRTPGVTVYYRVIAVGTTDLVSTPGNTATAVIAPLPVAPAAPTALAATVTGTSVALGWTASSSADVAGYFVERATVAAGPFTRISGTAPVTSSSYTDAGRTPGTTVYYRVIASGTNGLASTASNTATAVIAPLPVAPAAPTALAATVTGTSVALGWTASSSADVAGYFVERATVAAGPFTRISGTAPVTSSSYTDAGRTPGTTVYYRVIASGTNGLASTASNTATAVIAPLPVAPAAPTALAATVTGTSVALGWTASSSADVAGYFVERATVAAGPFTRISGTAPVTSSSYTDAGRTPGTTVYYRVIAVASSGLVSTPGNTATAVIAPLPTQSAIRINAGGGAVTAGGVTWAADANFSGSGKAYSNPAVTQIGGTTSDSIYLTERSTVGNLGAFGYDIPVIDGEYTVKLHFAEIYHGATGGGAGGAGKRVFSVNLEGGPTEIVGLDLNTVVAPMTAYIATRLVTVTGGNLDIDFTATVNQPKVSAIEIIPGAQPAPTAPAAPTGLTAAVSGTSNAIAWSASASSDAAGYVVERGTSATGPWTRLNAVPTTSLTLSDTTAPQNGTVYYRVSSFGSNGVTSAPTASVALTRAVPVQTMRINAGGPAVTAGGVSWLADTYFSGGGKSYTNPAVTQIAGTTADVLYFTERSTVSGPGSYAYDIPLPNGGYTVKLHFAEIYHGATGGGVGGTGKRVFNVNFEGGTTEIVALDLNARVAPMTAYITTNTVTVAGGNLDIDFSSTIDQPTLAAIEIVSVATAAVAPPAVVPPAAVGGGTTTAAPTVGSFVTAGAPQALAPSTAFASRSTPSRITVPGFVSGVGSPVATTQFSAPFSAVGTESFAMQPESTPNAAPAPGVQLDPLVATDRVAAVGNPELAKIVAAALALMVLLTGLAFIRRRRGPHFVTTPSARRELRGIASWS